MISVETMTSNCLKALHLPQELMQGMHPQTTFSWWSPVPFRIWPLPMPSRYGLNSGILAQYMAMFGVGEKPSRPIAMRS